MAYKDPKKQKAFAKAHYEANKALYKKRAIDHSKKIAEIIRKYILEYLKSHACIKCGEEDILVLEFDHRDRKKKLFSIGEAFHRGMTLIKVKREIEKCDILCANCHRRKTMRENGGWRIGR